jgi:DNA polymerase-3 subunit epsilon
MPVLRWWRRNAPAVVDEARWLVVDLETSGLDTDTDELIAIAAVAVRIDWLGRRAAITPGDSFEAVLRRASPTVDRDNILLHGIGVQHQREGLSADDALDAFARYASGSPLLAFHANFDKAFLERAFLAQRGRTLPNPWVDIEDLAVATRGDIGGTSLDHWMEHLGIRCARRHQAAADAYAEAEILLRIWPRIVSECASWSEVVRLAQARRWLGRA